MADGPLRPRAGQAHALPFDLKKLSPDARKSLEDLLKTVIHAQQQNNDSLHGDLVGFMKKFNLLAADVAFLAEQLGVEVDPATGAAIEATGVSMLHAELDAVNAADSHDADAISVADSAGHFDATDVEDALAEAYDDFEAHLADTSDAHDASAISVADAAGHFAATEVEAALAEAYDDFEAHGADGDAHHNEAHAHDEDDLTPDTVNAEEYVQFSGIYDAAMGANINDLAAGAVGIVRLTPDASRNLTGIVPSADGQLLMVVNAALAATGFTLTLVNDATSTAANRFFTPSSNNYVMRPGEGVVLWYDGTSDRWRIFSASIARHVGESDPHTGYRLESADHSHATTGLQAGNIAATSVTVADSAGHFAAAEVEAALAEAYDDFEDHSARHENGGADEISLDGLDGTPTAVSDHTGDTSDAHDASAISVLDTAGHFAATEVEAALAEAYDDFEAHLADTSDAHDASAVSITDSGGYFTGTEVEAALQELGAGGGGGATIDVQAFTADGVWEKPTDAARVHILAIGAGGGGGSGEVKSSGSTPRGGGGGAGGAVVRTNFAASVLPSTVAVTVGTGGAGGASVTTNGTVGNDGSAGGDSTFGTTTVVAKGGGGGAKGEAGGGAAGTPQDSSTFGAELGAAGGASVSTSAGDPGASTGQHASNADDRGAAGGGGGGSATGGDGNRSGGAGGAAYDLAGGTVQGGAGNTKGASYYLPGSGGAGANTNVAGSGTGTAGGAGGLYGGGGGGSGGTINNGDSGAGGAGANGAVVVVTFCGTLTTGGSFSPLDIGSLEAWYDASSIDQSDGTDVDSWLDLTGNGHTLTPGGTDPTFETNELNSKPVVRFAGASRIGNGSFTVSQPFTVVIVGRSSSDNDAVQRFIGENSGGNTFRVGYSWSTNIWSINAGTGLTAAGADTDYHVFLCEFTTTDVFEVDAVSTISGDAGSNGINAGFWLGDFNSGTQPLIGDIAEVLIFSAALDSGDKSDLYTYLNAKWGL